MLAHKYMEVIVAQRCGATLSRFQINIEQALLPDRLKHCQLPELWWKDAGSWIVYGGKATEQGDS